MSHLKLVVTKTPRKLKLPPPTDIQRPVPTAEFLARRVLALPLGEQTIGGALAELVNLFSQDSDTLAFRRTSTLTNKLILVGIWLIFPEEDNDPPMHGVVGYPADLVKRYPELKRALDQLDGLPLTLPAA